jgi:flagellar M-ring protein FliF
VDYEYGRRVEEVIAAPGAVRRLTVGVIVPPRISEDQQRRIVEIVQVAAGIDGSRGDIVSVQALGSSAVGMDALESNGQGANATDTSEKSDARNVHERFWGGGELSRWQWAGALVLLLLVGVALIAALRGNRARALSAMQREQLLKEIRRTLGEDPRVQPLPNK